MCDKSGNGKESLAEVMKAYSLQFLITYVVVLVCQTAAMSAADETGTDT